MRPMPPAVVLDAGAPSFVADHGLEAWIRQTFIEADGVLANPEHEHLQSAVIGCLWTSVPNRRQMRQVIGQAEIPSPQGNAWIRARQIQQLVDWFGEEPDFILTFSAHAANAMDDASWCALVEHELFHCAQAVNDFGLPKFNKDGMPVFSMRGHDVECFIGVARRYGPVEAGVKELVEALSRAPAAALGDISAVCGTCKS